MISKVSPSSKILSLVFFHLGTRPQSALLTFPFAATQVQSWFDIPTGTRARVIDQKLPIRENTLVFQNYMTRAHARNLV